MGMPTYGTCGNFGNPIGFSGVKKTVLWRFTIKANSFRIKVPVVLAVSSLFLAVVLTGLTVTATQMDFGNGILTRVSCAVLTRVATLLRIVAHSLKPVPAGHGSVKICSAFAVDQWRKVLLLLLPLAVALGFGHCRCFCRCL